MSKYDFKRSVEEWRRLPFDEVGYIRGNTFTDMADNQVRQKTQQFEHNRYNSWRNTNNQWRELLGLDTTHDKHILDFGCGFGIESLQFARAKNRISIADISQESLRAAKRVLNVHGFEPEQVIEVEGKPPYFSSKPIDVFYANGVLHHIPYARDILERAHKVLSPGGEVRLMVYTDIMWRERTGESLSPDAPQHPRFGDSVGLYTDWYSEDKLRKLAEGLFTLRTFVYLPPRKYYGVAILDR